MSSHREAPEISKDPVADSTDLYAFVSPDRPDTVTIIANYIPLQDPGRRPELLRVRRRRALPRSTSQRRSTARPTSSTSSGSAPGCATRHLPVQHRSDHLADQPQLQPAAVLLGDRVHGATARDARPGPGQPAVQHRAALDAELPGAGRLPPCTTCRAGRKVFAGQRPDGFYVDLGAIFDLLDLRPFQNLHLFPMPAAADGVNTLAHLQRAHDRASRCRSRELTWDGRTPTDPMAERAVHRGLGHGQPAHVPGSATRARSDAARLLPSGVPARQPAVQRGHRPDGPEGRVEPSRARARQDVRQVRRSIPSWPGCCRCSTRASSRTWPRSPAPRADLLAILLTGIPAGIVPGFQNYTGATQADLLRLNLAIPPASSPSTLGMLGGDLAGFPNGRRPADDVVAIELRAIAGRDLSAGRPELHPGRGSVAAHRRDVRTELPVLVPVPRHPPLRFRRGRMSAPDGHGVDGADHRHTAYGGPVMLDVGGDRGALVLLTTPDWAGAEIEISRLGGDGSRTHVGVHLRTAGSRTVHAAVYSSLPEGDYQLWAGAERPGPVVHVPGGSVVQERWVEPRVLHAAGTP